jgi:hypothetical protein
MRVKIREQRIYSGMLHAFGALGRAEPLQACFNGGDRQVKIWDAYSK